MEDDEDVVNSDGDTADSDSDSEDDMAAKDIEYRYGSTTECPVFLLRCTILKHSNLVMCDKTVRGRNAHKHDGKRRVGQKVKPKTVLACAVRLAVNVVNDYAITDGRATRPEYDAAASTFVPAKPRGWARRPKHGHTYGAKYIGKFKPAIAEMFNRGVQDKSLKLGPAQMLNRLRQQHAESRFSLPTESEILILISTLTKSSKNNGGGLVSVSSTGGRRGRKSKLAPEVFEFVNTMVEADPTVKPKQGLARVLEEFPDVPESIHQSIKSRISSVKSKLKAM